MAKFVQARNYYPHRRKKLRLIVWHDMEAPEANNTAENVAAWFAGPNAPKASAHVCCDNDSVVECVKPGDTAFHAPNANSDGYGVEIAGYRNQGSLGWRDDFSKATLTNAAKWLASLPALTDIPDRWLSDAQVADGLSAGHTTHEQISRVFNNPGGHTDPGPDFPKDFVLDALKRARGRTVAPAAAKGDRWLRYTNPRLSGQDVKNVQHALNVAGNKLDENGIYDQPTAQTVALFQQNRKITERGVGPQTWAALRKVVH